MSKLPDASETTQNAGPALKRQVLAIIADVLQREIDPQVNDLLRDETAGWDSVNHLRLALELEEALGITLSDEQWVSVNSLGDIMDVLSTLGVQSRDIDK